MEKLSLGMVGLLCGLAVFAALAPARRRWQGPGWGGEASGMALLLGRLDSVPVPPALLSAPWLEPVLARIVSQLAARSVVCTTHEASALVLLVVGAISLLSGIAAGHPLGLVVGAVGSVAVCAALSQRIVRGQSQQRARAMPHVLRSLASSIGAGASLAQAIAYVGTSEPGPLRVPFQRASMRIECGASLAEALDELAAELDIASGRMLVSALKISQRTGSPLQAVLTRLATLAERSGEFEQALMVKTAQVRLSAHVVSALPAIMVGLLVLLSDDFRRGLATQAGAVCVCLAALLDAAALLIIRRMMRKVL